MARPAKVFIVYSRKDEIFRDELALHLTLLRRQGIISEWHDRAIHSGMELEWAQRVDDRFNSADIILLLVSADFLASNYYDIELHSAIQRHEAGEACVIPILVRPAYWQEKPFGKLQALPKDAKPIESWENRDEAWMDVTQGIRQAVANLVERSKNLEPPVQQIKQPHLDQVAVTIRHTSRIGQGYIEPLLEVGNALPLHMVLIPSGTFLMGSPPEELDRRENESPQHIVTVPKFFMGRYPVTQEQWRAVADLPKVDRDLNPEPSRFKGDNLPVERVSWYDAIEFCDRLKQQTNRPYRLPTEAEWEYACRAGTTTPFYFGKTLTDELANYDASVNYADEIKGKKRKEPTPVDSFNIANAFGLSEMHGNVFEWCQDYLHESYERAPINGSAWLTKPESVARIRRGGSWDLGPRFSRSAYRSYGSPDYCTDTYGFRVVCSAPKTL